MAMWRDSEDCEDDGISRDKTNNGLTQWSASCESGRWQPVAGGLFCGKGAMSSAPRGYTRPTMMLANRFDVHQTDAAAFGAQPCTKRGDKNCKSSPTSRKADSWNRLTSSLVSLIRGIRSLILYLFGYYLLPFCWASWITNSPELKQCLCLNNLLVL